MACCPERPSHGAAPLPPRRSGDQLPELHLHTFSGCFRGLADGAAPRTATKTRCRPRRSVRCRRVVLKGGAITLTRNLLDPSDLLYVGQPGRGAAWPPPHLRPHPAMIPGYPLASGRSRPPPWCSGHSRRCEDVLPDGRSISQIGDARSTRRRSLPRLGGRRPPEVRDRLLEAFLPRRAVHLSSGDRRERRRCLVRYLHRLSRVFP